MADLIKAADALNLAQQPAAIRQAEAARNVEAAATAFLSDVEKVLGARVTQMANNGEVSARLFYKFDPDQVDVARVAGTKLYDLLHGHGYRNVSVNIDTFNVDQPVLEVELSWDNSDG